MIEAKGLSKKFKEVVAADGVSFVCPDGQITGLLGPNGAGKTTTLRMIAGILTPDSGTALINSFDISSHREEALSRLGVLSENTGLYGRLTPVEHLRYFAELHGMGSGPIDARIEELIDSLDLKEFASKRAEKLSKGMSQKVALARALVHDPQNLLFDEPTSGLDVMSQRAIQDLILKLKKEGKAVLLSTHIMPEAERICDVIYLIHEGKIVDVGSPGELKDKTGQANLEEAFLSIVGAGRQEVV